MAWHEVVLGGGFALAGVAVQQVFAMWSEKRLHRREREDRVRQEQHLAFVDLVQVGRRVQRVLVDLEQDPSSTPLQERLGQELDRLTESVATVRLVVTDRDVVASAEAFEDKAK